MARGGRNLWRMLPRIGRNWPKRPGRARVCSWCRTGRACCRLFPFACPGPRA